jgi:hypothetical protein
VQEQNPIPFQKKLSQPNNLAHWPVTLLHEPKVLNPKTQP